MRNCGDSDELSSEIGILLFETNKRGLLSLKDLRTRLARFSKQRGSSSRTIRLSIRALPGDQATQSVRDNYKIRHAEASQRKCANTTPHQG